MLEEQRRFLDRWRAACARSPAVHPHQLAAFEAEDFGELARAETLDAAWNRLRVAQAVGEPPPERAAAQDYVHAASPEWPALPAPEPPAVPGPLFTRAMLAAFELRAGGRADAGEHIEAAVRELHAADPGFEPAAYASRVPWRELPEWLPRGPGAAPPPLPDVARARRDWWARLGTAAPAEFPELAVPPAVGDAARAAAAPLRARSEAALARQAVWPDPLVERHHRALIDALDAAGTRTEVALAAAYADACLAIEADWNALLHAPLVAPLRARCGGADPARADPLARALLGVDPLTLRRTAGLLARTAVLAREPEVTLGAEQGEAGFELLADLRAHLEAGGSVPAVPRATEDFPFDLPERPVLSPEPRI